MKPRRAARTRVLIGGRPFFESWRIACARELARPAAGRAAPRGPSSRGSEPALPPGPAPSGSWGWTVLFRASSCRPRSPSAAAPSARPAPSAEPPFTSPASAPGCWRLRPSGDREAGQQPECRVGDVGVSHREALGHVVEQEAEDDQVGGAPLRRIGRILARHPVHAGDQPAHSPDQGHSERRDGEGRYPTHPSPRLGQQLEQRDEGHAPACHPCAQRRS
jgi:hypothetical protein